MKEFEIRKRSEATTLGQPYDFQSIMHYSNKEFSSNGRDTIQALSDPNMPLGNVNSLSAVDVMQINLLYKCPEGLKQGKCNDIGTQCVNRVASLFFPSHFYSFRFDCI